MVLKHRLMGVGLYILASHASGEGNKPVKTFVDKSTSQLTWTTSNDGTPLGKIQNVTYELTRIQWRGEPRDTFVRRTVNLKVSPVFEGAESITKLDFFVISDANQISPKPTFTMKFTEDDIELLDLHYLQTTKFYAGEWSINTLVSIPEGKEFLKFNERSYGRIDISNQKEDKPVFVGFLVNNDENDKALGTLFLAQTSGSLQALTIEARTTNSKQKLLPGALPNMRFESSNHNDTIHDGDHDRSPVLTLGNQTKKLGREALHGFDIVLTFSNETTHKPSWLYIRVPVIHGYFLGKKKAQLREALTVRP